MFAKTALIAFATLSTLGLAPAGHASPGGSGSADPNMMSETVSVAGLNLSSPAGAKIVLRRINTAAQTICGGEPDIRSERFALYHSCVKTTVGRTVASLDNPMVTALNGGQPATMAVADRR